MRFVLRTAAVAAGLPVLAACRDGGTGPDRVPSLSVEALGNATDPHVLVLGDGGQSVACLFTFSLTAAGDAGALAAWTGATLRFFAGADRASPLDSLTLTVAEMTERFGVAGIAPGERRAMEIGLLGSIPFGVEAEFRYQVQGSQAVGAARAYAPCVVPVHEAQSTPAVLSGITLTLPPGPLEPGDTVRVAWKAESPMGLWETGVAVSGAFERLHRVPAAYHKVMSRSVEFVVPADARLGEPVRVQVYAVDLLARVTAPLPLLTEPLTDVTAPVLEAATTTGVYSDVIAGQFGAGDSIRVHVWARDNQGVAYVVYEAGPVGALVRDSVPMPPQGPASLSLRTRSGWTGEGEVRLYVRDRSGHRSRTVQSAPGAVRFHPVRAVTVRTGTLAYRPADFAVDTRLGQLYVAAASHPALFFHSLSSLDQVAAVQLPAAAEEVDLWADGGAAVALIASPAALVLVDLAQRSVRSIVPLTPTSLRTAYGFRVAANGRALIVGRREDGQAVVVEHDLRTGAQRMREDAPAVPVPDAGVYASLDQSRLLVGAGCVYRADTDAFGPCARLWQGEFQGSPFLGSGTGAFWAQHDRVWDAALQPRPGTGDRAIAALSADDRHAYVADFDRARRVRIADGVVEDALAVHLHQLVRASADGTVLVSMQTAAGTGNLVAVIQLP